jgi:hypothetical protein
MPNQSTGMPKTQGKTHTVNPFPKNVSLPSSTTTKYKNENSRNPHSLTILTQQRFQNDIAVAYENEPQQLKPHITYNAS